MPRRDYSQKTFADTLIEGRSRRRKWPDRLDRIDALLDWARIDVPLDAINAEKRDGRGNAPPSMMKARLLAQWYDLSDPGLDDALKRVSSSLIHASPENAHTTGCFPGPL